MSRPALADGWYIQAAGRVWGPYPSARIAAFVDEGRVAPTTLVGARSTGPFGPAREQAGLKSLFGEPEAEPVVAEPAPARVEPATQSFHAARPAEPGRSARRPLLVWAALSTADAGEVEALLGAHGPFVPVEQPGLWLVLAYGGPQALRNDLTRRLKSGDRLLVVEAPLGSTAWFNLGAETDRVLRQLWSEVGQGA